MDWAAARHRSSRNARPTTCTPDGSPSISPVGTARPGTPTKLVTVHRRMPEPTRSRPALSRDSSPGSTGGSPKDGPSSSGYSSRNCHVDGGPRGLLDFGAQRRAAADRAAAEYDRWTALVRGLPEAEPWASFHVRHETEGAAYPVDRARADYRAQPRVKAADASDEFGGRFLGDVIGELGVPRAQYAQHAADQAVPGYAYLGPDGRWEAPGELGWFGMSSETGSERAAYLDQMNERLDRLAPETVLVAVDCHI